MQRRWFLLFAAALALGVSANAKPNFTGDWKLNADKSDFGPMPPPSAMAIKIDHDDPNLKVATTQSGAQGDVSYEAKYTTDGKESTNSMGPMEAKSTVNWDGDALLFSTKLEAGEMKFDAKGKWMLSEDGKTLTQTIHITSAQGEFDIKQILEKQAK
jgi:hypothetical protein